MPHIIFGTYSKPAAITAIFQFDVSDISDAVAELKSRRITSDNEFIQITVMKNNEIYTAKEDSSECKCEIYITSDSIIYRNDEKDICEEIEHSALPEWTKQNLRDMMDKVGMGL